MDSTKRITALLDEIFDHGALSDCFVVDIVQKGKSVTVYFDSDTGVTFEKCSQLSRLLENRIDEENILPEDYVLDVSSPGVDRPLKFWRQYPRHLNRTLKVTLKDGTGMEGKMTGITEDAFVLEMEKRQVVEIPFADVKESFVQISF